MQISDRLGPLGGGVFARTDQRKQTYRQAPESQGRPPLIDLSLGSSDLRPPQQVLDAMAEALQDPGSSSYCLNAGTAPFQHAVAAWCSQRFGVDIDPGSQVQLLVGSQEGTAHLPLAVLNPGDPALVLDPCYPSHLGGLVLAGADVQTLALSPTDGWTPDLTAVSESNWDQLKLFVFGYPHNPTARVGDQGVLDAVMQRGISHDLVIAHDNPYVDLSLVGEAPSLLRSPGWRERGIEFFSLSKGWCMGGIRLGFAVGAAPLIAALRQVKSVIDFNQSLALQRGGITALSEYSDWPAGLRPVYRDRRDQVSAALRGKGWSVPTAEMALYLWLPIPDWAQALGWDDERCAAELLDQCGVALTPGSGFGEGGRGWLRMALVRPVDVLLEAVDRLGGCGERFV
ncbi:MAG: aminotransferase class I/II-fold pyridoxal phosphate-dependent enzyme [Synechococcus sp.]